jgi:hypothetical protein
MSVVVCLLELGWGGENVSEPDCHCPGEAREKAGVVGRLEYARGRPFKDEKSCSSST